MLFGVPHFNESSRSMLNFQELGILWSYFYSSFRKWGLRNAFSRRQFHCAESGRESPLSFPPSPRSTASPQDLRAESHAFGARRKNVVLLSFPHLSETASQRERGEPDATRCFRGQSLMSDWKGGGNATSDRCAC